MSDLISRQAAIDALNIGTDLLRRVLDETDIVGAEREKYEWGLGLIESYISDMKELPSAQQEMVRCKECRHANECHKNVQYTRHEPNSVTIGYSPIEWCSRGERRIDGRFNQQTSGD